LYVQVGPITEDQFRSIITNEDIVMNQETFTVDRMEELFADIVGDHVSISFTKLDFRNDLTTGWSIGQFLPV